MAELKEAMSGSIFEAFIPLAQELKKRPDGEYLLAFALKSFFTKHRIERAQDREKAQHKLTEHVHRERAEGSLRHGRGERGGEGRDERRGRRRERDGARERDDGRGAPPERDAEPHAVVEVAARTVEVAAGNEGQGQERGQIFSPWVSRTVPTRPGCERRCRRSRPGSSCSRSRSVDRTASSG